MRSLSDLGGSTKFCQDEVLVLIDGEPICRADRTWPKSFATNSVGNWTLHDNAGVDIYEEWIWGGLPTNADLWSVFDGLRLPMDVDVHFLRNLLVETVGVVGRRLSACRIESVGRLMKLKEEGVAKCLDEIDWLGPEVSPLNWRFDLPALVRGPTRNTRALVFVIDGSVVDERGVRQPIVRFSSPWMLEQFRIRLLKANREYGEKAIRANMLWELVKRTRAKTDRKVWEARERAFHETIASRRVVLRECGEPENEFELQQARAYVFEGVRAEEGGGWIVGDPLRPEEPWKRWSLGPPVQRLALWALGSEDEASLYVPKPGNFPAVDSIYFDRRAMRIILFQYTLQEKRLIDQGLVREALAEVDVPRGFRTILAFVRPSSTGDAPTVLRYFPTRPEWNCREVEVGHVTASKDCLSIWNCVYDEPMAESLATALEMLESDEKVRDFAGAEPQRIAAGAV
jgi:hypothetical protein